MREVGEKTFLAWVLHNLAVDSRFINGFGNDCAAVLLGTRSDALVLKIDRAALPMATLRGWSDYRVWGRLAVTSNCSDLLAGGGEPLAVMIALVLSGDFTTRDARSIIDGCAEECANRGIVFAGGDTKQGGEPQVVGCAVGTVRTDRVLGRSGAQPGDVVVCAGQLGGFLGAYLQLDEADRAGHGRLASELLEYVTYPRARWKEAAFLRDERVGPVAAMDTSDGLYDAIATLSAPHGARLDHRQLPFHPAAVQCQSELSVPLLNLALGMGDWNIMYVFRPAIWEVIERAVVRSGVQLSAIGVVTEEPGVRITHSPGVERDRALKPIYNEHFVARLEDEGDLLDRLKAPILEDE